VDRDGVAQPGSYLADLRFLEKAKRYLNPIGAGWYECDETFFLFQSLVYAALHTQSVLVARDRIAPNVLRFDEQFQIVDDTDLWIRLGMEGRIGYLDRCLGCYRVHSAGISKNQLRLLEDSVALHTLNYERVKGQLTRAEQAAYRGKVARYQGSLGYAYLANGRSIEARRAYWDALAWSRSLRATANYAKSLLPGPVRDSLRRVFRASTRMI
jgi:hypothetical protein